MSNVECRMSKRCCESLILCYESELFQRIRSFRGLRRKHDISLHRSLTEHVRFSGGF